MKYEIYKILTILILYGRENIKHKVEKHVLKITILINIKLTLFS